MRPRAHTSVSSREVNPIRIGWVKGNGLDTRRVSAAAETAETLRRFLAALSANKRARNVNFGIASDHGG